MHGHGHAGDAEAALHGAALGKGPLDVGGFAVGGEPLDGTDLAAGGGRRGHQAGGDEPPVHLDVAGPALTLRAPVLGPGEPEPLAQHVEQRLPDPGLGDGPVGPVDAQHVGGPGVFEVGSGRCFHDGLGGGVGDGPGVGGDLRRGLRTRLRLGLGFVLGRGQFGRFRRFRRFGRLARFGRSGRFDRFRGGFGCGRFRLGLGRAHGFRFQVRMRLLGDAARRPGGIRYVPYIRNVGGGQHRLRRGLLARGLPDLGPGLGLPGLRQLVRPGGGRAAGEGGGRGRAPLLDQRRGGELAGFFREFTLRDRDGPLAGAREGGLVGEVPLGRGGRVAGGLRRGRGHGGGRGGLRPHHGLRTRRGVASGVDCPVSSVGMRQTPVAPGSVAAAGVSGTIIGGT